MTRRTTRALGGGTGTLYRYLPLYFLVVLIVIRDEPPGKLVPNIFDPSLLSV